MNHYMLSAYSKSFTMCIRELENILSVSFLINTIIIANVGCISAKPS